MLLAEMVNTSAASQALYAAVRLGLPELLASGPEASATLAGRVPCDPALLHRLLRALAASGVCTELDDGRFALTDLGDCLRSDAPGSLRAYVLHWAGPMWSVWGRLFHTVKTGRNPRDLVTRRDAFESLGRQTEADRNFNDAMSEMSALVASEVAACAAIPTDTRICDVGGGQGVLLSTLLRANPTCTGILFDRPQVVEGAHARLTAAGVADRCVVSEGSFFDEVPEGADVYLLKSVLHDWDDEDATAILRAVHAAMPPDGRLLLIERVLPERMSSTARDRFVAASDLLMALAASGRERTEADYRALLAGAGFAFRSRLDTAAHYSVIEAVRG